MKPHIVEAGNAKKIWDWLNTRGGLAIWGCLDFSDPGKTWTTPARSAEGVPVTKPHWQCTDKPVLILTNPDDVVVSVPKEVDRFHIALRIGGNGMSIKVSSGGTRRIDRALARAHEEHKTTSFYRFDYETQEAVIYVDGPLTPISEWMKTH